MEHKPNEPAQDLPNLSKLTDPEESALAMDPNPNTEKPAGAAELMTPDDAPGPEDE